MQVFLALDPKGKEGFLLSKLTSREAEQMRSKEFANQFKNLSLADFKNYQPTTNENIPTQIAQIEEVDFYSTLRAVKQKYDLMGCFCL